MTNKDRDQRGQGVSILFVDDDNTILGLGKVYLERYGFEVSTAGSAAEAVQMLSKRTYDAIISDYDMPDLDGIGLLKHLKSAGDMTPFLLLTGKGGEEVAIEALNSGADSYILKRGYPDLEFADLSTKIISVVSQRQAEDRAQTVHQELNTLVSNLYAGILTVYEDGKVETANQAFCEIFNLSDPPEKLSGLTSEEVMHKILNVYFSPAEAGARIQEIVALGKPVKGEEVALCDGRFVLRDFIPIVSANGQKKGRIWHHLEITERKRSEEALHEANHKLRILTGLTRHDLLNKLCALQVFHVLATEASDLDITQNYIHQAYQVAKRMEAIIGFTREYEDFGIAPCGWLYVHPIINSAEMELSPHRLSIYNDIPEDLEVYSEPILRKVFITILENAIRHGEKVTSVRFSCSELEHSLIISCEDNGIGVPSEKKESIFDHVHEKHTDIGLFLSREILSISGLSIRECGEPGKGARFDIQVPVGKYRVLHHSGELNETLPTIPMVDTPGYCMEPVRKEMGIITPDMNQGRKGISLLYIDEDQDLLLSGKEFLEKRHGFEVTTAENAEVAIHLICQISYDVIISAYGLPMMDGIELLKHLREAGDTTPFILLTGKGGENLAVEALSAGADFYILKTGDPKVQYADLTNKIEFAVSRRRTEKALSESQKKIAESFETLKLKDFALESSVNGCVITDISGIITFINPALLKIFGYTRSDDVVGRNALVFCQYPDEVLQIFTTVQETGDWTGELNGVRKDGNFIVIIGSIYLIRDVSENPIGMFGSFIDITENKALEQQIKISLSEKETLLREIHHRVKNNLQIISSLLNMQARQVDHPETLEVLRESQDRVKTMALVHEHLYQGENISQISIENYFKSLGMMLLKNYAVAGKNIMFEVRVPPISLDLNTVIPLGLIMNEIITNSLKYAFIDKESGRIRISASDNPDTFTLIVSDDGVGIGEENLQSPETLGFRLIHGLTRQIRGTVMVDGKNGTTYTLNIPKISFPDRE